MQGQQDEKDACDCAAQLLQNLLEKYPPSEGSDRIEECDAASCVSEDLGTVQGSQLIEEAAMDRAMVCRMLNSIESDAAESAELIHALETSVQSQKASLQELQVMRQSQHVIHLHTRNCENPN